MNKVVKNLLIITCLAGSCVFILSPSKLYLSTHYLSTIPDDTFYDDQWAIEKVELDKAWDIYTGSSITKVGIIDSGIDAEHEDLEPNINSTIGHHFGNANISELTDSVGHGTHVAGIIGAVGNNEVGVSGACWEVDLVSLSVANYSSSTIYIPGINEAIAYASDQNHFIPILNASVGVPYDTLVQRVEDVFEFISDFYNSMDDYDGLLVCAAGNGSNFNYSNGVNIDSFTNTIFPASYSSSNMIVVGNSDSSDNKAFSSNYGATKVDLFAPGEVIKSTLPNDNYGNRSGTSMASPLVAGTVALLKSIDPTLTASGIKTAILNNVDIVNGLSGYCSTGGRLNAYQAALSILPSILPNMSSISFVSNTTYQKFLKLNCSSGHYNLSINNAVPCRITLYQHYNGSPLIQQSFSSVGQHSINFLSTSSQMVYVRVENTGNSNGTISIGATYQNHSYIDHFSYYNPTYHKAFCSCGDYVLLPHLLYIDNPESGYGTCAICSSLVPLAGNIVLDSANNNLDTILDLYNQTIIECYNYN